MAEAPSVTIKQAVERAAKIFENEAEINDTFFQFADEWSTYWMNGGLYLTKDGKADPIPIIAKIQQQAKTCGDMLKISEGEIAQHVAKYLREQGGALQYGRREKFKAATAAQGMAEAEIARQKNSQTFKFGIDGLDDFGGVKGGEMLSILGNPGSYKTALMINGIRNWIVCGGGKVLLFELDMTRNEIYNRLLTIQLQCPMWRLKELADTAEYKKAKQQIIAYCDGKMVDNSDARLEIFGMDDAEGEAWTLETVIEAIERKAPAVVCIDYLTLLKSEQDKNKPQNDYTAANKAVETLYSIAKKYGIIVVNISQMSKESMQIQAQKGYGGTPLGGTVVENRSDAMIELFRDKETNEMGNITSTIVATIRKARRNTQTVGEHYALIQKYGRFNVTADKAIIIKNEPKRIYTTAANTW